MKTFVKQCNCNAMSSTGRIIVEPQVWKSDFIVEQNIVFHPEPVCNECDTPWLPYQDGKPLQPKEKIPTAQSLDPIADMIKACGYKTEQPTSITFTQIKGKQQ